MSEKLEKILNIDYLISTFDINNSDLSNFELRCKFEGKVVGTFKVTVTAVEITGIKEVTGQKEKYYVGETLNQ